MVEFHYSEVEERVAAIELEFEETVGKYLINSYIKYLKINKN